MLIASPDHFTYICDECTLERSRLKTGPDEPDRPQTVTESLFDQWSGSCKRASSLDLYVFSSEGAQICKGCLIVCGQILTNEAKKRSSINAKDETKTIRIRADFNGLFGELLCISHSASCADEQGRPVTLHSGMKSTCLLGRFTRIHGGRNRHLLVQSRRTYTD
jgi:hypothetical protein